MTNEQPASPPPEPEKIAVEREDVPDPQEVRPLSEFIKATPVPKFFSFIPKTFEEQMKFAEIVARSSLSPKDYRGKPEDVFIAMQYGAELGLPPLQAIQNIAVINGKPGVYGDLGKALLLDRGFKIELRDEKEIASKGEAWCRVTRPDGQKSEKTFTKDMAVTAGLWGQNTWKSYPFRMLSWRAFWWAARDVAADVLKGLGGIEELRDIKARAIDTEVVDTPKEIAAPQEPTQANPVVDAAPVAAQAAPEPPKNGLSPEERKKVVELMTENGVSPDIMRAHLSKKYGITDEKRPTAFVPKDKYAELCAWIESPQDDLIV